MKKILALVLAFAMMFSTITVAFAEGEVSAEAKALATVGMLVGDGNGVTVEYTAKEMDRLTAAAALLKLKGLYAEAAAYVGDANFADADTVKWAEGKNIMAYLKANPGLGFAGNENGEFKPFDKINEQSYVKVLLETLGYKQSTAEVVGDFAWADVLTFAASVGLAPVNATPFTVDALAKLTVAALKAEMKDGKVLINVLVDGGKVDKEKAIAAELYVDAPVVTAALDSAKAIGNSVVEVTFDAAVNEGAEDVAMYAIEGLEVKAAVVAGEDVVRLTTAAMTAGKLYTLTVGDVKVKFTGIEKVSGKPEIAGVTSTDVEEVVIEFSKDLDFASATDAANYTIAGIEVVEAELDEDTVTLTTSGLANKKQYTVKFTNLKSIDGVVNKSGSKSFYTRFDTLAPTVSKVEAKTNVQVNVTFNEEVSEATAEDLANYVIKTGDTELSIESATLVEDENNDDELRIVELTTEAQKPNARYSITIENISDATKAENTMAKTVTKTFYGKREDTKAPTYTVKPYAISRNQIIVEFADESDIDEASVLDVNNYTLTKGSDELTIDAAEEYDFEDGVYQVMLTVEDLNVGTYALEVIDIADEFGNAMEDEKKLYFSVTRDSYASATVVGYEVTATNKIEVEFSKPLVEATAEDLANYEFDNDLGAPVKASYEDRVVTLTVTGFDLGEEYELTITGVEDLAGNVLDLDFEFVAELGEEDEDAPELVDIYAVNKYVVAVSFDEAVEYVETTVLNLSNGVTLEAKALTEDDTVIEFSADGEVLTTANEYAVLDGSLLGITDAAGNAYVPADLDEYVVYGNDEDPEELEVLSVVQVDGKSFEVTMSRPVVIIGEDLDWTLDLNDDEDVVTFTKNDGKIQDTDPYYYAVDLSLLLADAHGVVATNLDEEDETRLYVEFEDDDAPYIVNVTATDRFTVEIEYSEAMDENNPGSYAVKNADDSVSKALIAPTGIEVDDELVILTFTTPFEGRYDYILVIGADQAKDLVGKAAEEQEDDEFYFSGTDLAPVELEVADEIPDGDGPVSTPDGQASSIEEVVESVTGTVLYVVFSRSVYDYAGGGYEPEDPEEWNYYDASNGGVEIISVSLSENRMVATVTLSGKAGVDDIIEAGDFHTIPTVDGTANKCFGEPDTAAREADGTWTLESEFQAMNAETHN